MLHWSRMAEDPSKAYRRILILRIVAGAVAGIGLTLYALLMVYTTRNNVVISPFLLILPALGITGMTVYAFEQRCPDCGGKFYGNILRFFTTSSCGSCGYSGGPPSKKPD